MEKSRVYTGTYKGYFSVTIESEIVRVEILPELGRKLVTTLTDWDMSGWDECFPASIQIY